MVIAPRAALAPAMTRMRDRTWPDLLLRLCLMALSALVITTTIAMRSGSPDQDSGVFLYVARAILRGQMPYIDVWDHKPPLVYYIDALGLSLGQGLQGLWAIEVVLFTLATLAGYSALRRCFGTLPAFTGSVLWLLAAFSLLGGGNFTEEYGLACAFGALWAASHVRLRRNGSSGLWWPALAGCFCALELLCKPTGAGVAVGLGMALLIDLRHHTKPALRVGLAALAGFIAPLALTAAYFAARHALPALIDQVITYNRVYARTTLAGQFQSGVLGLAILSLTGLAPWTALWWLQAMMRLGRARGRGLAVWQRSPLLIVALIGLPLDSLLAIADGRPYLHNYLLVLPSCAILSAYGVRVLKRLSPPNLPRVPLLALPLFVLWVLFVVTAAPLTFVNPSLLPAVVPSAAPLLAGSAIYAVWSRRRSIAADSARSLLLIPLALASVSLSLWQAPGHITSYKGAKLTPVVSFLRTHTGPRDTVLMWGSASYDLVAADRNAPTRYVYQYALYTKGYTTPAMVNGFVAAIRAHPPRAIVETGERCIPPLSALTRAQWSLEAWCTIPGPIRGLTHFLVTHYTRQDVRGCDDPHCVVYLWTAATRRTSGT